MLQAFYETHHFTQGVSAKNLNTPIVRAGPLLAYTFQRPPRGLFQRPTLFVVTSWYFKHRYRTGQDISQAIPYAILALRFEGELWRNSAADP
ncbi:MAG: hypothetical protein R3C68_19680 [Myxococcota bacterium]